MTQDDNDKTPLQQAAALLGSRGGSVMTPRKLAALKRNARKPRPGARKAAREARRALAAKLPLEHGNDSV